MLTSGDVTRDKLGELLTAEQRAEIDGRAAAWKPKPLPPFKTLIHTPAEMETGADQTQQAGAARAQ
jgi:hypothetical protein